MFTYHIIQVIKGGEFYNVDLMRRKLVPEGKRPMPIGVFVRDKYIQSALREVSRIEYPKKVIDLSVKRVGTILEEEAFSSLLRGSGWRPENPLCNTG